ncbi:MAG TPA: response regulator transcription factor [Aggregatilineales bacterium]|nr:response regulator transcription factor [Aggregatilineales bacterium]
MAFILAVDDEADLLGTLSRVLGHEGYEVALAQSAEDAWFKIVNRRPDLVILDVMMPGMDGLALCRRLRADTRYDDLPILFLTARNDNDDLVVGLDAGGDDYVIKPFELTELQARVRALLRRAQAKISTVLEVGRIRLDSEASEVRIDGKPIQLTATEHRLLRFLMEHPHQALSPGKLLESVWDYPPDTGDPDLVRAHVRNLRVKLEQSNSEQQYIKTLHGVGYMLTP